MGHGGSTASADPTRLAVGEADEDFKEYLLSQKEAFELMLNDKLPLETLIEHYYPPSFPIEPIVTQRTVEVCRTSWERVKAIERDGRSGMVYFFDVFYARLFERSSLFKEFFKGDMKKKGKILIRIMEFFCGLSLKDPRPFRAAMMRLGHMHHKMGIRPWMFSVFVETMVNTITYVLEEEATYEVAAAWTNIAAYVMRHLLPPAIVGAIKKDESDFAYHDASAQLYATARAAAERRCAKHGGGKAALSPKAGGSDERGGKHDSVRPASHRLPPLHGEAKVPSLPKPIPPQPAPAQAHPASRPTSPEPLFQRHTSFRSGGPCTITVDSTKRSEKNLLNQSGGSKDRPSTPSKQSPMNKQDSASSITGQLAKTTGHESTTMAETATASSSSSSAGTVTAKPSTPAAITDGTAAPAEKTAHANLDLVTEIERLDDLDSSGLFSLS